MVHQELNLMPFMTGAENIWIRREPKNALGFIDHAELRDRTQSLFDELNIDIDPEIEIQNLSISNRQMVEIAKAVSYNSDVLIMAAAPADFTPAHPSDGKLKKSGDAGLTVEFVQTTDVLAQGFGGFAIGCGFIGRAAY